MANLQETPKPRIVLELQPDGSYTIISFVNGSQVSEAIQPGGLIHQVRDALQEQRNRHTNAAARAARLAAERADKLHKQVWQISAATPGQGVAFANRVIGPIPVNKRENPSAKNNILTPSIDLL